MHFREKYDDRMPVWALTELLELGQLSVLYRGLRQQDAEEIALAFGAPTKRIMVSWLASLNYVRNVAAHHARLFNRKLQHAPARQRRRPQWRRPSGGRRTGGEALTFRCRRSRSDWRPCAIYAHGHVGVDDREEGQVRAGVGSGWDKAA